MKPLYARIHTANLFFQADTWTVNFPRFELETSFQFPVDSIITGFILSSSIQNASATIFAGVALATCQPDILNLNSDSQILLSHVVGPYTGEPTSIPVCRSNGGGFEKTGGFIPRKANEPVSLFSGADSASDTIVGASATIFYVHWHDWLSANSLPADLPLL